MHGHLSNSIKYIVIALDIPLAALSQLEHTSRPLQQLTHIRIYVSVKSMFYLSYSMAVEINRSFLEGFLELFQEDGFQR